MSKIIIPSKNIYSKTNDILKKNSIGKVLFNYNQARVEAQDNVEVANLHDNVFDTNESATAYSLFLPSGFQEFNFSGKINTYTHHFFGVISGVRMEQFYHTKAETVYDIPFDNFDENVYIDGIYQSLETKNVTVLGTLEKYSGTAVITVYMNGKIGCGSITIDEEKPNETKELTYTIPTSIASYESDEFYDSDIGSYEKISSTSQVEIEKAIDIKKVDTDLDINGSAIWKLSELLAPVGMEYWTISYSTNKGGEGLCSSPYYVPATKYVYTPKEAYIKVNGSTTVVKLTNKEIQKTSPKSSNPFSVESNELMQDKTAYDSFAQRVLDVYENGKETATIRCGINDYYATKSANNISVQWGKFEYDSIKRSYFYSLPDFLYVLRSNSKVKALLRDEQTAYYEAYAQNNKIYVKPLEEHIGKISIIYLSYDYIELDKDLEKVVDTSKQDSMCFKMHNVVLPLTRNGAGEEEFLSYDKNGNPKAFEIIGINMIYDGAVYQELTLQEYIE